MSVERDEESAQASAGPEYTELPEGWAWAELNDLRSADERPITDGPFGSNLASRHYTESGARVLRLQNIGDGEFRDEHAYISMDHFEQLTAHEVLPGDLVIASLGDNLPRACIIPEGLGPAIVKADCIRFRAHAEISTQWLLCSLISPATKRHAAASLRGIGRARLGLNGIRSLPVPVPPAAEQRRIADALTERLARLEKIARRTAKARAYVTALRKEVLLNAVPEPEEWPSDWQATTTGKAGAVDLGRARHPDWHTGPKMRPYLRVANVFEDHIDITSLMEMDFSEGLGKYRLLPGDILLNEGQSPHLVGRPAMYRGSPNGLAFTNSLLRFRAGEGVLPGWALLVFRRHLHAGRFMREVRITTNIAHLSAARLRAVEFPVPSLDEQRRIIRETKGRLAKVDALGRLLDRAESHSTALRRALLAEAFAGRLVPQDLDDEPAEDLLKRIRADREAAEVERKAARRAATQTRRKSRTKPRASDPTDAPPHPAPTTNTPLLEGEQTTLPLEFNA
ncbi:restriction endonuclease subunit S [Streptomyces sp. CC219B]|uniref:restriction endonuclease subunit S n=1 Tax=Streptomyces sp. CC219B TaxID=3044574 RepID=UPI0024A9BBEE|nr:restriction endonuclease subunit S [Streptomyces sp. CC219B]